MTVEAIVVKKPDALLGYTTVFHENVKLSIEACWAMDFARTMLQQAEVARALGAASETELPKITPELIAKRACALSELMFIELRKREWICDGPSLAEMQREFAPADAG